MQSVVIVLQHHRAGLDVVIPPPRCVVGGCLNLSASRVVVGRFQRDHGTMQLADAANVDIAVYFKAW